MLYVSVFITRLSSVPDNMNMRHNIISPIPLSLQQWHQSHRGENALIGPFLHFRDVVSCSIQSLTKLCSDTNSTQHSVLLRNEDRKTNSVPNRRAYVQHTTGTSPHISPEHFIRYNRIKQKSSKKNKTGSLGK